MSSSDQAPDEAKELALIEKLELRLALADSDKKLQTLLATFLCPMLLKLASPHRSVRDKVIGVCGHLGVRTREPSLVLPLKALLKQFKDVENSLVRHFDLMYLSLGLSRVSAAERLELLPSVCEGFSKSFQPSRANAASLFNVMLRILSEVKFPNRGSKDDTEFRSKVGLEGNDEDARVIAEMLGKLILAGPSGNSNTCPGLSESDCDFLKFILKPGENDDSKPLHLIETKVVAARFLASGAFTDAERFIPSLFASVDPNFRVTDVGDGMLKRAIPAVDLEDEKLIRKLYSLYLGTESEKTPPVRAPLQMKILGLFCKSKTATNFVEQIVQVFQRGLAISASGSDVGPSAQKGLEAAKMRGQVFAFTNWVARIASPEVLEKLAPSLVSDLRHYIESQGWPRPNEDILSGRSAEIESRNYAYECIGLLSKTRAQELLLDSNLDLLRWLFRSLGVDNSGKETSISIEAALSSVLGAFSKSRDVELGSALAELFLYFMTLEPGEKDDSGLDVIRSTRYVAARFANRCLPYHDIKARWIDLLASAAGSGERNEVIEEGRKGLDPYWYRIFNPTTIVNDFGNTKTSQQDRYAMPNFEDLVQFLFDERMRALQLDREYATAINYCCSVLFNEALEKSSRAPNVDPEWQKNLDTLVANDEAAREIIENHLSERLAVDYPVLDTLLEASFNGLVNDSLGDPATSGSSFLQLCSLGRGLSFKKLTERVNELKGPIFSSKHSSRQAASHVYGVIASLAPKQKPAQLQDIFLQKLTKWDSAVGSEVNEIHGSILSLSYLLSRQNARGERTENYEANVKSLREAIFSIIQQGRSKDIVEAAVTGLGQLLLFGVLGLEDVTAMEGDGSSTTMAKLEKLAKDGNEAAVSAIGYAAMMVPENSGEQLDKLIEKLYALHDVRQPELHFSVGAALSCAAIGWQSKSLIGVLDVGGHKPSTAPRSSCLASVLEKIFDFCSQTKPAMRQASAIWLLCLVQFCGHLPEINGKLRQLQQAFKGFLSDRESLNQETASRGLTLVYEKGDREVKDDLIRDLVGSFTSTKSNLSGTVTGDTQLFDSGALPTGDGSITTYKDIINLAGEVGDPSLVYRFMSMASNSSIWSSRAAFGRFGLSRILSDSSVDGYLAHNPKLYSALFRYRFDPNTNVRRAMNDIWTGLVKDPKEVIETYFDTIIEDLLKSILGKEWRTREASCAAIAELLQGRSFQTYEPYLTRIWTVTFKVCDDIKETVRRAARSLARVLTGILVRSLEAGESSSATTNAMLEKVIPFLLSGSGLESTASEVQGFALHTLLEIIKKGNKKNLGPFIGELAGGRLVLLLSSIEPEAVNYIHLNADKYGMTEQQIDDARLSSVKMSPMMEAIERCMDMLDESTMKDFASHLTNSAKAAIGLPSRVGVSRVLVSLSTKHNQLFRPYANQFLRLHRKQVLDRNDTVSTSAASACGYITRVASDEEVLKHIQYAKKLYFTSDEDKQRTMSGELILGMAKYATDKSQHLASSILPFVFIAMHDTNEATKEVFKAAWEESVGGSRTVQLYLREISSICSENLGSSRWALKHASALAIADLVSYLGKDVSKANAETVWPLIDEALGGKTWEGKEKVLDAFIKFVKSSSLAKQDEKVFQHMKKIIMREAKRNNTGMYRQQAMAALGDFEIEFPEIDWFEEVFPVLEPVIESLLESSQDMDVDSQTPNLPSSKDVGQATLANAQIALFNSVNSSRGAQKLDESIKQSLVLAKKSMSQELLVQKAIYRSQTAMLKRITKKDCSLNDVTLQSFAEELSGAHDLIEQARSEGAKLAVALARLAQQKPAPKKEIVDILKSWIKVERSQEIKRLLSEAQTLLT